MQREVQVQRVPEYLRVSASLHRQCGSPLPNQNGDRAYLPHLHLDRGPPFPHLRRDCARLCHICTGRDCAQIVMRTDGLGCLAAHVGCGPLRSARLARKGPRGGALGTARMPRPVGSSALGCARRRWFVCLYGRAASVGRYKLSKGDDLDDDDEDDDDDAPRVKRIRGRCALPPRQRPTDPINLHKLASFRVVGRPFRCCCCPVCVVWRRVHYSATSASPLRSLDWGLRSSRAKLGRTAALARRSHGLSRGGRRTELGVHSSNSTEHTLLGRQPDLRGRSEAVIERRAVN